MMTSEEMSRKVDHRTCDEKDSVITRGRRKKGMIMICDQKGEGTSEP